MPRETPKQGTFTNLFSCPQCTVDELAVLCKQLRQRVELLKCDGFTSDGWLRSLSTPQGSYDLEPWPGTPRPCDGFYAATEGGVGRGGGRIRRPG